MGEIGDITLLLQRARAGESDAEAALFTRVYDELQRLARSKLAADDGSSGLDAGALVHEAYLRLCGSGPALPTTNRGHFFAYTASVMRSVIVDTARARKAAKRGSGVADVTLITGFDRDTSQPAPEIEALDEALAQLKRIDERSHSVVELRYFAGLSIEEVADVLALSPATVKREWQRARGFLLNRLGETASG